MAVVNGGIAADVELEGVLIELGRQRKMVCFRADLLASKCGAFDPAIVQRLAPECFEVSTGLLFLPVTAHQIVASRISLPGEQGDEFVRAFAVVKGSDQRLNDADRSVICAGIAPGFEFMRLIDVPVRQIGGFILVEA